LGNIKSLEFLLQHIEDINELNQNLLKFINFDVIMILLKYGYVFSKDMFEINFRYLFIHSDNINQLKELYELGGNFNYILSIEKEYENNPPRKEEIIQNYNYILCGTIIRNQQIIVSDLEMLVYNNFFDNIKMIVEYNTNEMMEELDRLIIIAIANGRMEILLYFVALGGTININFGIKIACYFGHIDMVKYLLSNGACLEPELFTICANGSNTFFGRDIYSSEFIKNNNIFRNDIFNFGNFHEEIFKILMINDIDMSDINFFKLIKTQPYIIEIIKYGINKGINIECFYDLHNKNIKIANFLVDCGLDIDIETVSNTDTDDFF
jgi:hypothetical protein